MDLSALQSHIGLYAAGAIALSGVFVAVVPLVQWARRANWMRVLVFVSAATIATLAAQKPNAGSGTEGVGRQSAASLSQTMLREGGADDCSEVDHADGLRFTQIVPDTNGCSMAVAWTTNELFDTLVVRHSQSLESSGFANITNLSVSAGVTNLSFRLERSIWSLIIPPQSFFSLWGLNWCDDDDSDGLANGWELAHGLNPRSSLGNDGAHGDLDGDGIENAVEYALGTNPNASDSDDDGISDSDERGYIRRLDEFHWVDLADVQPVYGLPWSGGFADYWGAYCMGSFPAGMAMAGNDLLRYLVFENLHIGLFTPTDYFGAIFPGSGDLSDSASSNASLVIAPAWKPFRCEFGNTNSFMRVGQDPQTGSMAFEFHDVKLLGSGEGLTCQVIVPPGDGDVVRISYLSADFWMDGSHGEVVGVQNKRISTDDGYYNLTWDFSVYGPLLPHTTYEYRLGSGTNPLSADTDGDGIGDWDECNVHGTDPLDVDSDGDGVCDGEEVSTWHSDPLSPDSDEDGLPDQWEIANGLSPTVAAGDDGWNGDLDGDGLANGLEFEIGTNPSDVDSDGDGLSDLEEVVLGTDPLDADTDHDGMSDGWEVSYGMSPTSSEGQDGAEFDNDEDGLSNFEEFAYGTDPTHPHTFSSSVGDALYVANGMSEITPSDCVAVTLSIGDPSGSRSELWKIVLQEDAPLGRKFQVVCGAYGQVRTATVNLEPGRHYVGTIEHLASVGLVADYDWQAQVDGLPSSEVMAEERANWLSIADKLVMVDNSSGLLGLCNDSFSDVNLAEGRHFDVFTVKVTPTNVKFNWDTTNSSFDAINLRKNRDTPYDIAEGEYASAHSYPICYVKGTRPVVKAKFAVEPVVVGSLKIGAALQGSLLSDIVARTVTFVDGVSDYVAFPMSDEVSSAVGMNPSNAFVWYASEFNGTPLAAARNVATTGPHKTYVILAEPVEPWDNTWDEDNTSMAWSDALDIACSEGWAAGATAWVGAASGVTRGVYECGAFIYDYKGFGRSHFTGREGAFHLVKKFVRLTNAIHCINSEPEIPYAVNCTDCSSFVTSFANLLGCSLYSSQMRNHAGYGFLTNPFMAIGYSTWDPHWPTWSFAYHEVAWSGTCEDGDLVFDACLCVDGDSDPENEPRIKQYPAGMAFSDGSPLAPFVYREKLTPNNSDGYYSCSADSSKMVRRILR